ncbi:ATP-binding protein [Vibrio nigripulchritudo]|uniref:ATP-binding protein n=1 Tax=Vibrio nigripulchritudo TaxID=28173 RepID=UPI0024901201|nr:ATP-binding protein [Vibrio nigripulchritudo]BDU36719.1 sensor histidine kinase [Vibrio nigripulchritudo]BDU42429.1 sensor histidine kinase [Vibrio nigripulchritudo]
MLIKPSFIRSLSLRNRLLSAAVIWLGLMIFAAGLLIPNLIKDYLREDIRQQLSLSLDELTANIDVDGHGRMVMPFRLSDPRFNRPYSGLYWMAATESQVMRSRSLWDQLITFKRFKGARGANGEKLIYIQRNIYLPDFSSPITITVGLDEQPLEDTLHALMGQVWLVLTMLFVGILVLIGLQVSWSLRPLGKMQKELHKLRSGEQSALENHYPKEIQPLTSDLNALLFHYQELLQRARNHAGNLSHALKTPISVLKNEAALLDPETRAKLEPSVQNLQQQIDYHLGRARMAGSMHILAVSCQPSEQVDAISIAFDKVFADRDILLINELEADLKVAVESTDMDEMLGNLLENGYKWANSQIRVFSETISDKQVALVVEDDGPGIPNEMKEHVLKRGVRLDEETPGSGLGLNIVKEMAHSYRGELVLEDNSSGGTKAKLIINLCNSQNKR